MQKRTSSHVTWWKSVQRRVLAAIAGFGLIAGGMVATAPSAAAACGYSTPVELQSAFTSQTYAGVPTTTRIPFVFKYGSGAACLRGMIFTFVGGGGTDVQAVRANVSQNGVSGEASAEWVPKALEYKLLVDVVIEYGYYGSMDTSRFTYEGPLTGKAFVPLPTPGAPASVNTTATNRNLRVNWGAAISNSASVVEYVVTRLETGEVLCRGLVYYCDVADAPDGAYTYKVSALNQIGAGGEAQAQGVLVAPPQVPTISSSSLVNEGRAFALGWVASTGTSAIPVVYRIYDDTGVEVCGRPVAPGELGTTLTCTVQPPKSGAAYTLKVETAMGDNTSAPTTVLKPHPDSFFRTCSKVKGLPRDCSVGKSWTFEWCTSQKGTARVTTGGGSKVKNVKAKKSKDCVKRKPYSTKFSVTEKKNGTKKYLVSLPDGSRKVVRVTVRESE